MTNNATQKQGAIKVSITTAILLFFVKIGVGVFTQSLAILASALDSLLDFLVSVGNYFAAKKSDTAPTQEFRYGFGKIEGVLGLFQGIFIAISGLILGGMGAWKIWNGGEIVHVDAAIWVMIFSTLVTFLLVQFLKKKAQKTKSLILEADAMHYQSDLFSNIAILAGIIIIWSTQKFWIDGLISILIAGLIIKSGVEIFQKSLYLLLDREIDPETRNAIEVVLLNAVKQGRIDSYHYFRTRQSGSKIFVDVHIVLNETILLKLAHDIAEEIEDKIEAIIGEGGEVLIHLDPVDDSV